MAVVVCTLFENHYHYGLAAFVNSLYNKGYRGEVYAGYRGELPPWAVNLNESLTINWSGVNTYKINEGITLNFLPINSEMHLANYKPTFLLSLFEKLNGVDGIVYFDPDIVIRCQWSFYETWIKYGVSLVHEIISNDMPASHPIRKGWEQVVYKSNRTVIRTINSYINSGFCGVLKENIEFVEVWEDIINVASKYYDLHINQFAHSKDRSNLFYAHDQDALNIAAMCCQSPISEMGPEGMDFIDGGWTMSHAVGFLKPWKKNYLSSAIKGNVPSFADKQFWANTSFPIQCFSNNKIRLKRLCIAIAALIGRFYKRS